MSSGNFVSSRYEADSGTIYRIRVQPETLSASIGGANTAPAGAIDGEGSARVGGGNRRFGVKARSVTLAWSETPPAGYAEGEYLRVPILTPARYAAITLGQSGTYLGVGVTVVGKNPERVR